MESDWLVESWRLPKLGAVRDSESRVSKVVSKQRNITNPAEASQSFELTNGVFACIPCCVVWCL